jgi:hypothetical protein
LAYYRKQASLIDYRERDQTLAKALVMLNAFVLSTLLEQQLGLPNIVKYLLSLSVLWALTSYTLKAEKRFKGGLFIESIIIVFTIYSFYLLVNSIRFELFFLQELFAEQFYFLPYLTPILLLRVSFGLSFFKKLIEWTYYLLPIAILVELYVISNALTQEDYPINVVSILSFSLAPMLLLGTSHLNSKKHSQLLLLMYFLFFAFVTASLGRRGETLEILFMLSWGYWIKIKSSSISKSKRRLIITSGLVLFLGAGIFIADRKDDIFLFERGLSQEGFEESRGETVEMFLLDFGSRSGDWLFGRGLNGKIQKFDRGEEGKSRSIEIGYFNALLKGGLLYLVPMIILLLSAFYLGYYSSNNDLSKLLAGFAFWQIFYMVTFGLPNFNFSYTFLWIAVSANLNPEFRKLNNLDLTRVLKLKN